MSGRLLLLGTLLAGCVHKKVVFDDSDLPDAAADIPLRAPMEVLADAASSDDPTPRARALAHLIRTSSEPAGGAFGPRGLYDPDPWVQRITLGALAERLSEPETAALIERWVVEGNSLSDPYVRAKAAIQLRQAGHHGGKDAIVAACHSTDAGWRAAPLCLAAAEWGDTTALTPLGAALAGGEISLETDFVVAVGESGLTALLPSLREGGAVIEEELRLPYAVAEMALGDPAGQDALRKALTDPDEEVGLEALDYVALLETPAAVELLRKADSGGPDVVRAYAGVVLAARGLGSPDRLERAMRSEDAEVRGLAVRFAVEASRDDLRRADKVAKKVVRDGLVDPDPGVRLEALRASSVIVQPEADAPLQASLIDEALAVRVEAAGALVSLGRRADPG